MLRFHANALSGVFVFSDGKFAVTIAGETLIPKLSGLANDKKLQAMSEGQALKTAKGMWLRNHNDFITIGKVLPDNVLKQVFQFHFDGDHTMTFARKIETLTFQNGHWLAHNVSESVIGEDKVEARKMKEMNWDVDLKPSILQMGEDEPDEMTLSELKRYLEIQKKNHLFAANYQLAYWQRLIQPLTTVVMMVLAIPFIFGPLRSASMGSKLLTGAAVGFGFHMINRIFGPISQVFQLPVEVAAFAPTLLFAMIGIYLVRRVK